MTSSCVGTDDEVRALAILEAQQLIPVVIPAPRLLPQLARNDRGQEHLLRPGTGHLLADDPLDLLHNAPAERQERIDAGRHLAQVSAADHQNVGRHLSLGGSLFQRRDQRLGLAHGERLNMRTWARGTSLKQRHPRAPRESRWPNTTGSGTSASPASPRGTLPAKPRADGALSFVIQKHEARRLHYDFRLELNGVLLSWAVPKGPSLDPKRSAWPCTSRITRSLRRLRGDHPDGRIRRRHGAALGPGHLGARDPVAGCTKGNLKFILKGEKLQGGFALIRLGGRRAREEGEKACV